MTLTRPFADSSPAFKSVPGEAWKGIVLGRSSMRGRHGDLLLMKGSKRACLFRCQRAFYRSLVR